MDLFRHHAQPASDGGMNLTPVLTSARPPVSSGAGITLGADVISANLHLLPARAFGVVGLYATQQGGGSGYIAATQAQLAEYPDCVTIGQLPVGDPYWCDELDFEAGAATASELKDWAAGARESFTRGLHPGQRMPLVYVSASNVHVVANTLTDAGITSGVGFHLANWNLAEASAAAEVAARSGPFPVCGLQYADAGPWDLDVWATAWLTTRVKAPAPAGYSAPLRLKATGGHDSVRLTWDAPGTPGLPDPAGYEVYVYGSAACTRSSLVPTWAPRITSVTTIEGGSLARGRTYYARVTAAGPGGTLVRPGTWAGVKFTTG